MKAEIVEKIRALAEQERVLASTDEFGELVSEFFKIQSEEEHQWEVQKLERIEAGEKPESIEKPVYEYLDEAKALINVFNEKKKVEQKEIKDERKKNLEKKMTYIAALKDLIQNEENIGRAIARYRDIQEGWKAVGDIPRDKRQELQREFSNLVDSFQYNINIYKEIKDHDLSKNLTLKQDIIAKLKELLKIERIKDVEKQFHELQDEWNSVGGTHQEDWEKLKTEYWDTVNAIYDKIRSFYQDRKEKQGQNIEEKKKLIERLIEIKKDYPNNHKAWKKVTDKVIKLQEEWRSIGYGPKEENDAVWEEFRGHCNEFFDKKQEFYQSQGEVYDKIKEKKEALIAEAEKFRGSTNWKEGTKQIIALQKKWKDVGSAGPKYENKLWKKFRGPIDDFFAAKDQHFGAMDADFKANLEKKTAIIAKLEKLKAKKDIKKSQEELQEISKEFAGIGRVPFKDKNEIQNRFKKALDAKYQEFGISADDKEQMMFAMRLKQIESSDNKEELVDKEKGFIRKKIDRLNKEKNQFETNLAFFSNADESNPLFKNVMDSIKNVDEKIEGYKKQLRILSDALKAQSENTETEEE